MDEIISGTESEEDKTKTKWGRIIQKPGKGKAYYLRFFYRGKEFTRSLDAVKFSYAKIAAPAVRKKAQEDRDLELDRGPALPEVERAILVHDELYREKPGDNGFLQSFYPILTTNKNTRYDQEKLAALYFGEMARLTKIEYEALTLAAMTPNMIKDTLQAVRVGWAKKTTQKVGVFLKKFLRFEMALGRIPSNQKLMDELTDLIPSHTAVTKHRQKEIPGEIWDDRTELAPVLAACKAGHPATRPLDYEVYWTSRFLGLPPSDIYQLLPEDFREGPQGLELSKERSKNDEDTIAEYNQPIRKGIPEDKETETIIRERLAVTKRGERLFAQDLKVTRARNDRQDDKTRWVSNLSGRRIALQMALGLPQKGIKGLRATFVSFWKARHIPNDTLHSWCGWAPGSTMDRKFYSTAAASSYWTLPSGQ